MKKNEKSSAEKLFQRGLRKILLSLQKKKLIFSFVKIEGKKIYKIIFSKGDNFVHLHFAFSENYRGDIVPLYTLKKAGYVFNAENFCIGFGTDFKSSSIKNLEKLLRSEAKKHIKGYNLEKRFFKDVKKLINPHSDLGLVSVDKTTVLQEKNRCGDFILIFNSGLKIHIDVKSSFYGVIAFLKNKNNRNGKIVLPLNYFKSKELKISLKLILDEFKTISGSKKYKNLIVSFHLRNALTA